MKNLGEGSSGYPSFCHMIFLRQPARIMVTLVAGLVRFKAINHFFTYYSLFCWVQQGAATQFQVRL